MKATENGAAFTTATTTTTTTTTTATSSIVATIDVTYPVLLRLRGQAPHATEPATLSAAAQHPPSTQRAQPKNKIKWTKTALSLSTPVLHRHENTRGRICGGLQRRLLGRGGGKEVVGGVLLGRGGGKEVVGGVLLGCCRRSCAVVGKTQWQLHQATDHLQHILAAYLRITVKCL